MATVRTNETASELVIDELDHVRLKRTVVDKDKTLQAGWEGIVLMCLGGGQAFLVEFDPIDDDYFYVSAEDIEKILV